MHFLANRLYKPFDVVIDTVHPDVRMLVDFRDGISESIFNQGFYDEKLTRFILKNVKPDWFCVDVGANIGWFTCLVSTMASSGRVWGFECNPSVFEMCRRNVGLNNLDNVVLSTNAVGGSKSSMEFLCFEHSGHGHFAVDKKSHNISKEIIDVDVVSLDEYLEDIERFDFLKIDVEGFEFDVIIGARVLISRFHPIIIFEYNNQSECLSFLSGLGYGFYLLDDNGDLVGFDNVNVLKPNDNIVCISEC